MTHSEKPGESTDPFVSFSEREEHETGVAQRTNVYASSKPKVKTRLSSDLIDIDLESGSNLMHGTQIQQRLPRALKAIEANMGGDMYLTMAPEHPYVHGGMIAYGDHIYCGHGHNNGFPLCIDFATGEEVWSGGRGPGGGSAAILLADGHLYFRYEDGTMALIEASPERYNLKGSFKLATRNGKSWPHPVIVDGLLYARDQDALLCYDVRR